MEIVSLAQEDIEVAALRAATILRAGGVILYPTDTLYGLGADALSDEAVAKVYAIKGRDESKPLHALVASIEMAARYGEISERVRCMIEHLPAGQATFIVKKKPEFTTGIFRRLDTFGFRIPDHPFCLALLRAYASPITATSANKAGEEAQRSLGEILRQIGQSAGEIALAIDASAVSGRAASTVVDLSNSEPRILREGAVPEEDVHNAWRAYSA